MLVKLVCIFEAALIGSMIILSTMAGAAASPTVWEKNASAEVIGEETAVA